MVKSIEEQVEDIYKNSLRDLGIEYKTKNDSINSTIDKALNTSPSKSGGKGKNFPDIKLLLITENNRQIPVMIEVKGSKGVLKSLTDDGEFNPKGKVKYAVNGAIHYANAILQYSNLDEVIAIGINGYKDSDSDSEIKNKEFESYYLSKKLFGIPKKIDQIKDFTLFKKSNLNQLIQILDDLVITPEERERLKFQKENDLEVKIKSIHQKIYDDPSFKNALETNQKLFLFCGLIMAGMSIPNIADLYLPSNNVDTNNDGICILTRIKDFLNSRNSDQSKTTMILDLLTGVFTNKQLWERNNGESKLKTLYNEVKSNIIPLLNTNLHLDFTGKIFNSINDWVQIENDIQNDVVLTPRYITKLMVQLTKVNKDSLVWDSAMGSAGFLVSAMETMIDDAKNTIQDAEELKKKIENIKHKQLLGIEILDNIFTLAVLNMILMGDGSTNLVKDDSFVYNQNSQFPFTPNVFLLNPPYSREGKGFIFVRDAFNKMGNGYGCVLIQENAGSGNGLPYTKDILKNNTLLASIHMPDNIFIGKSTVQTAIYLFKVGEKHKLNKSVIFIDMSNDGYSRIARKKSSQAVNLKDTDHAKERYQEIADLILGNIPQTNYYTKANGLVFEDTISLEGNDWTFAQHKKINDKPAIDDFKKTVKDYLSFKISHIIQNEDIQLGKQ